MGGPDPWAQVRMPGMELGGGGGQEKVGHC